MRSSIITILMLFVLLLAQGCQKFLYDPDPSDTAIESATLQIGIITQAASTKASSDGTLGEAEYAIKSLRIFAFETDGSLDMTDYVEYSSPVTSSVTHEIEVVQAAQKIMYVIVNEPTGVFDNIDEIDSPSDLKNIDFTIASAMNGGFNADYSFDSSKFVIPMTAISTIDASGSRDVTIAVDRAVARVDLMLDKNIDAYYNTIKLSSSTKFSVNGVVINSSLMQPESLPTYSSDDVIDAFATISSDVELLSETSDNSSAKRVLSFYIAERNYDKDDDDTKITIEVDRLLIDDIIVNINNTIVLGDLTGSSSLTEIKRNYIYKLYATYVGVQQELVADQFSVVDWDLEVYDTEIEGVMIAVDNTLAMDWLRNGNSYTGPNTSFGSNKAIEVYLPVFTGYDDTGLVEYDFEKYDFEMIAGASYDLKALSLENSLLSYIPWITDAKMVFTSDKTGYVSVTYTPMYTTYDLQSYPIRFKSDNVVKQMKVIYDNGYIPYEFLPDHLKEKAPGGIVFAKRGYLQHPRDVADVFSRDEDGYYRGEHSLNATDALDYCKQLGDAWYMPSQDDLSAMLLGVKELGASYRFQDTGSAYGATATPALYWTETEAATDNYYWCGNFIYNNGEITEDNVSSWIEARSGDENNFIRCMLYLK